MHIVKSAIVPVGSSLVAVGGDQKIVMNASDILENNSKPSISGGRYTVCTGDYLMALSTIDTNQIKDGGVTNADLKASNCGQSMFRTNATSITSDLTVASTENAGAFGPITISATITVNGVLTVV